MSFPTSYTFQVGESALQSLRSEGCKQSPANPNRKIKAALEELHEQGFMHCDVRLPNICFNEQLAAVLIDVDRACRKLLGNSIVSDFNSSLGGVLSQY